MGGEEGVYSFPEVLVQDGGAFGCDPAVSFPVVQPSLGDGSLEVLAVGAEGDLSSLAVLADPFEGFVGSAEFHSVVGGAWPVRWRKASPSSVRNTAAKPPGPSGLERQEPSV